jgi:uridine kinase
LQGNLKSGSASGKTTFVEKIMNDPELKDRIAIMGMDNFYKKMPKGTDPDEYDFDHPKSLDI